MLYKPFFLNALARNLPRSLLWGFCRFYTVNPSPYMFLLEDPEFSVVGASPEIPYPTHREAKLTSVPLLELVAVDTMKKEFGARNDLLGDKECAEHLMLVTLPPMISAVSLNMVLLRSLIT